MNGTFPMTQEGYDLLKQELKHLTTVERPDVINAIAEARAHGDLSENAEYHAAKERQGYIEGRIQELNGKLASANVIDVSKLSGDKIVFGATVSFVDVDTEEGYIDFVMNEKRLIKSGVQRISNLSKRIIESIDTDSIWHQRIINTILEKIKKYRLLI